MTDSMISTEQINKKSLTKQWLSINVQQIYSMLWLGHDFKAEPTG